MNININDKITIINNSNLPDAIILNSNYNKLIGEYYDLDEKKHYIILKAVSQQRIEELSTNA